MKISSSFLCLAVLLTAFNNADAQFQPFPGAGPIGAAGSLGGQPTFRPMQTDVQAGLPGRLWVEANVAERGLGYTGSYLSLGGKRRLFEDFLDGRWLIEGQLNHSIDENENDFFTNIGIERVFSIGAAGADVSLGGWYDYNQAPKGFFTHDFHQVGLSGKIKTRRWDLLANGYFPLGDTDKTFGGTVENSPLSNIASQNFFFRRLATDRALTGFDTTLRFRPKQLAFANGTFDFGAYGYSSDEEEFFGGGRARLGFQAMRGAIVSVELNHDERFKTTGLLSFGWTFGASGGRGSEYAGRGRDFEATLRNDHIVRATDDGGLIHNPKTGAPYNVRHVDNLRGGIDGDGTFENPYATIAAAAQASGQNDVIFVATGDGTRAGLRGDIVLQDGQLLLGDGGTYAIPDAATGTLFPLITGGGTGPILSAGIGTGPTVVTLADCNTIAGLSIDATGRTNGILGDGVDSGRIQSVDVIGAGGDGINLNAVSGDWQITDSSFSNNRRSGLVVANVTDPNASFVVQNNVASNNLRDGIRFENFDSDIFFVDANTTSSNQGDGLFIGNYANTNGNGLNITNHTSDSNIGFGINVLEGNGKLNIFGPTITNNVTGGIMTRNWTNVPGENTIVSGLPDAPAIIDGNGGVNLRFELTDRDLNQNILVTNANVSNSGGQGIRGTVSAPGSVMNIDVRDQVSVSGNSFTGIAMVATNSGTINTQIGSDDPNSPPMPITNNADGGASGIDLFAENGSAAGPSVVNAVVQNVAIQNGIDVLPSVTPGVPDLFGATTGVNIRSIGNANVDILVRDSSIGGPANTDTPATLDVTNGIVANLDNDGNMLVNRVEVNNVDLVVGFVDNVNGNGGTGVLFNTFDDTFSDLIVRNATIVPNGIQSDSPEGQDPDVFSDTRGNRGIVLNATGAAVVEDNVLPEDAQLGAGLVGPGNVLGASRALPQVTTDGIEDNKTRLLIADNIIRDFTFEGIDINTDGDANLLLDISGNTVNNNGAGLDNDVSNNNVFDEPLPPGEDTTGAPAVDQLYFFDGIDIDAAGDSTISARIRGNTLLLNYERGLSLNTFQTAQINAIVQGNNFGDNDLGEDVNILTPLTAVGQDNRPQLNTRAVFDFEAINNEEYYFRNYETPVFTLAGNEGVEDGDNNGDLYDPVNGIVVTDDEDSPTGGAGVFIPGNVGADVFGNPLFTGRANLNLVLDSNNFDLGVDLQDFAAFPGFFAFGGVGDNSDIGGPANPDTGEATPTTLGIVGGLIDAVDANFDVMGFTPR